MAGNIVEVESQGDISSHTQRIEGLPKSLRPSGAKLGHLSHRMAKQVAFQQALDMQVLVLSPILEMLTNNKLVERTDERYIPNTSNDD